MVIICRYGEIFLKGKNRVFFERALVGNIRAFMKKHGASGTIHSVRNRIFIESSTSLPFLRHVFGITSFSQATKACIDVQKIADVACALLEQRTGHFSSFRVSCQRLTKTNPLTSLEINQQVGGLLCQRLGKHVSLSAPDVDIGVEIIHDAAYVFIDTTSGPSGLPVGVSGTVAVLFDCPEAETAALLMMKRGCHVVGIAFGQKQLDFSFLSLFLVAELPFEYIISIEQLTSIAVQHSALALVVGRLDVSDITLNSHLPILCPLIGMDQMEVRGLFASHENIY